MSGSQVRGKIVLATALAALAIVATLALWALPSQREASAIHNLAVGLDFDPSGTSASGVYDPFNLPSFETCAPVAVGQQVSIDLFFLDVERLVAFESDLQYDGSKVQVVGSQVLLFMDAQPLSNVFNASQNNPDPVTGVLTNPDTDGQYEAAAADSGNVAGDDGSGVVARITFQGLASGLSPVTLTGLDLDADTTVDTGTTLTADDPANPGSAVFLGDSQPPPNGDGFYDETFINEQGTIAVGGDTDGDGLFDVGCPGQISDNCAFVSNPGQEDLDGDGMGDACDGDIDGDHYWNVQEQAMGSDLTNSSKTPEICDGLDNDGDTLLDEGYDLSRPGGGAANGVPDCTENVDTDGDGIFNPIDPNDDNDSWTDVREIWTRTNTLNHCPVTSSDYAWVPDSDNNQFVNMLDVIRFIPHFLTKESDPALAPFYNRRFDWNADTVVNIQDVILVIPWFFATCTP